MRGVRHFAGPTSLPVTEENKMATEKITAETRTEFGKGAARRIRRADKVPAVIYGHGNDPIHIALPGHDAMMALKHGGANALLEIEIDGKTQLGLTKQIQVDPITRFLEHIDFVAVRKGEKVTVDVPVHVVGEAGPDTLVVTENTTISLEAEATHIPEFIEVDIEGLQAGTQILASQLALPDGTTLVVDPDTLVINVTQAQSAEDLEAELAEAEAEVGIVHEPSDDDLAEAQVEAAAEDADREGGVAPAAEGGDEE
jgi:large subunit ribosomal protein L25